MTTRYEYLHGIVSAVTTIMLIVCHGCAFAEDVFVGKFMSETRENFGTDKYGEYVLTVKRVGEKYTLSISKDGVNMGEVVGVPCGTENESYLSGRPSGESRALCKLTGQAIQPLLSYSQNGINIPVVGKSYKTKYYLRIQWAIRGFRKVG